MNPAQSPFLLQLGWDVLRFNVNVRIVINKIVLTSIPDVLL